MKQIMLLALCVACSLSGSGAELEVILHGKIVNSKTHKPVDAKVDIFQNSDFLTIEPVTVAGGEFKAPLRGGGMFFISISAPGYMEASDTLWVKSDTGKTIEKLFYIVPIEVGLTVTLNNIYFTFGKPELTAESLPELDKTVDFFKANAGIHFEIAGHTDRYGAQEYNLKLSQDRAQAVVNYLVAHGVDKSQLVAQGYGSTRPVSTERTLEAAARNRRVEFTVLKVGELAEK